jgi:prepilin peptidase CpaA
MPISLPDPLPGGLYGLALATAFIAAYFDIRWRRIPNWLVLASLVVGLAGNLWLRGGTGLLLSLGGLLFASLIYFPLYLLKGIGAGDVKLMAALGAILGVKPWVWILLFAAIFGAIAGLVLAAAKGRVREILWNTGLLVRELASFRVPHKRHEQLQLHHEKALRMPHGVAIAVGTALLVWLMVTRAGQG